MILFTYLLTYIEQELIEIKYQHQRRYVARPCLGAHAAMTNDKVLASIIAAGLPSTTHDDNKMYFVAGAPKHSCRVHGRLGGLSHD